MTHIRQRKPPETHVPCASPFYSVPRDQATPPNFTITTGNATKCHTTPHFPPFSPTFYHPHPTVITLRITSRWGDSRIKPTAVFIFHGVGGNRHGQLLTNAWTGGQRYVLSNRQFPASAIYYKHHVGTRRNNPMTVRFCWVLRLCLSFNSYTNSRNSTFKSTS